MGALWIKLKWPNFVSNKENNKDPGDPFWCWCFIKFLLDYQTARLGSAAYHQDLLAVDSYDWDGCLVIFLFDYHWRNINNLRKGIFEAIEWPACFATEGEGIALQIFSLRPTVANNITIHYYLRVEITIQRIQWLINLAERHLECCVGVAYYQSDLWFFHYAH